MTVLPLEPIESDASFRRRAYEALRTAIVETNIYETPPDALRLDERRLAARLGVSRTPIREALARLEHEGLVENIPRRGYFIVRKNKEELVQIITVWAALESMAARLITVNATAEEIASLRTIFATFVDGRLQANLDEYSEANLLFHQRIVEISHCKQLQVTADGILIHVRSIRHRTIGENRRFERSIVDHIHIIEALEARDAELAERLVRDHALNLAAHVTQFMNELSAP